jgi:AcrR family transcriptional regulator
LNAAAISLFAERGYDETSVDDIAEAAGISVRTLFRYFTSKEDIVFAKTGEISGFLGGIVDQPSELSPMSAIRKAFLQQQLLDDDEQDLVLLFHKALSTTAALQGRYLAYREDFRRQIAKALARRAGRRKASETDILTALVAETVLHHAYSRWVEASGKVKLASLIDSAFQTFGDLAAMEA